MTGLAAVVVGLAAGVVFYARSGSSDQPRVAPSAGLEVGGNVGNQAPGFDLRLIDGSTVNSAELVTARKPAFYFFFATW